MSAPLPRGFVRLTCSYSGRRIAYPAASIVAYELADAGDVPIQGWKLPKRSSIAVVGDDNETTSTEVSESFDEIQAALVAALGAQGADGPLTIVTNGSNFDPAAAALDQIREALGVPAHGDTLLYAKNLRAEVVRLTEALNAQGGGA